MLYDMYHLAFLTSIPISYKRLANASTESVVAITGSIARRPEQQQRTGGGQDVELNVTGCKTLIWLHFFSSPALRVRVLNPAAPLPFKFGDKAPSEVRYYQHEELCPSSSSSSSSSTTTTASQPFSLQELRLMHRPLDLRRPDLQRNLAVR